MITKWWTERKFVLTSKMTSISKFHQLIWNKIGRKESEIDLSGNRSYFPPKPKHFQSIEQDVEITHFFSCFQNDFSRCKDAASEWCIICEWEHQVAGQFSSDLADAITSVRHCQEVTGLVNGNHLRLLKASWSRQGFVKHFLWSRSAPMNCVWKKFSAILPNVSILSSNTVAL